MTKKRKAKGKTQIVKAVPRGNYAIQNVQEYQEATTSLTQVQLFVLTEIAAFSRPADIRRALEEMNLGEEVTDSWIEAQSAPAKRSDKYRAIIIYLRSQARQQMDLIPVANPVFRLKELNRIVEHTNDERVRLVALKEAHLQAQDLKEKSGSGKITWSDLVEQMRLEKEADQNDLDCAAQKEAGDD